MLKHGGQVILMPSADRCQLRKSDGKGQTEWEEGRKTLKVHSRMTATGEVCVSDVCGPSTRIIPPSQSKNNKDEDGMSFVDVQIQTNPRPAHAITGEQTCVCLKRDWYTCVFVILCLTDRSNLLKKLLATWSYANTAQQLKQWGLLMISLHST